MARIRARLGPAEFRHRFSRLDRYFSSTGTQEPLSTAHEPPKSAQDGPRGRHGRFPAAQEPPRAHPGGTQEAQKPAKTLYCRRFFWFRLNATREPPRPHQEAPKSPPGRPRSRPRAAQEPPRRPKSRQEPPRTPPRALRRAPEAVVRADFRHRFSQLHRCFSSRGPQEPPRTARKPKTACPRGPEARNLTIMLSEITVQKVCRDRSRPDAQRT